MPTALIAEDEPLLAMALASALARAWPALHLRTPHAQDGEEAHEQALSHLPDVLFLDIRMPGRSGLEAAQAIVEDWPEGRPLPLIVFVTAYDQYALQAFEASAVDYLLKPVQPARLAATCQRLQTLLAQRAAPEPSAPALPASEDDALMRRLRQLLALTNAPAPARPAGPATETETETEGAKPAPATPSDTPTAPAAGERLKIIQASSGNALHLVPVDEVVYFEAADKYIRVVTAERELLIRTALRELLAQLDGDDFWQVHRGTVVRASAIQHAVRDEVGRLWLHLRQRPERLAVSRLYAGRFKAM